MGCGISRYGFVNHVEACSFHPFKRKIVEISRDDIGGGTNSTKLLLKNNGEDDADSNSHDKTSSSPLNNKVNAEMVDSSDASAGKDKDQDQVEIISKNVEVWAAAESGGDKDKEESNEDDDGNDDERRISNFDGWIGSPSFREYCVDCDCDDSEDHDNSPNNGNSTEGEKEETKTKREKTSASPKPNEACAWPVLPSKAKKKGKKKGGKFGKVFSMGRPRNFMHAATCYNPNASASASGNKPAGKPIEKTD